MKTLWLTSILFFTQFTGTTTEPTGTMTKDQRTYLANYLKSTQKELLKELRGLTREH